MKKQLHDIGRDSAWYFLATVVTSLLAFVAVPIFTRTLVPKEYGIYSLVAGTIMLVSTLGSVWLSLAIVRYFPEYDRSGDLDEFYSTVFHYAPHLFAFILLVALPLLIIFWPADSYKSTVLLGVLIFPCVLLFRVGLGIARARQFSMQYALQAILTDSGRYLLGAALISLMGFGINGIFIGWLFTLVLAIFLQTITLSTWKYFHFKERSRTLERDLFKFGSPLILANFMGTLVAILGRYVIQLFKGAAQVGLYSVVYSLCLAVFAFITSFVALGATPVVTRAFEDDGEDKAVGLIRNITRYYLLVLIPTVIALWILRHRIMMVITSPEYYPALSIMLPAALGIALGEMVFIPSLSINLKKKTNLVIVPAITATALNITLNFVLIPFIGYAGAAWAALASFFLYFVFITLSARKLMSWDFPWDMLMKVCISSSAMGVSLYFLNRIQEQGVVALALLILAGAAIYLAFILILRGITHAEIRVMFSMIREMPGLKKRANSKKEI